MIRATQIETAHAHGAAPAALPGGAHLFGGRGCRYLGQSLASVGRHSVAVFALAAMTVQPAPAQSSPSDLVGAFIPVTVPSGQQVLLSEVLLDETPGALWARFRFVAPQISRSETSGAIAEDDFQRSAADMDHLCESLALDYLRQHELTPQMVVISFSDRPVEFGISDPEATQFFEAYRPEGARCIWEAF